MKFTTSTILALLVAVNSSADAFSPVGTNSRVVSTPTALASTAAKAQISAPKKTEDMLTHDGETGMIYDKSVQKTYGRFPLTIKNGKGCKLYDSNGKEYLDCVAGIATCALGHSNDALTAAITKQMKEVHHVSNLYLIPAQAALADWLCANSVADKAFFCNSGAEANEAAIKCARRHATNRGIEKPIIITAEQSFHGRTMGSLSATGQPKYHKGFGYEGRMLEGFKFVPYNNPEALKAAVKEIQETPGQGLAAIMMEALQGEGGIIPGDAEFFKTIRSLCDENDAFMICDEVQIGMGRSGKLWGYENLSVKPDIFTSAKALGGGVPIGAMLARGVAADVFGPGDHASTYGGNPLACAAGLAVAQTMYDEDILTNVQERGAQLSAGLKEIAAKHPSTLGPSRGWGLLQGIQVINKDIAPGKIVSAAMEEGLLLVGAGADVVRFVPPLIITKEEMASALKMFEKAVAKVELANKSP